MKRIVVKGLMLLAILLVLAACGDAGDASSPALPELDGTVTISHTGTVAAGTTLSASYTGSEDVSFRWYRNGTVTEITGTLCSTIEGGSGKYVVTVSAPGFAIKTSSPVTVTPFGGFANNDGYIGPYLTADGEQLYNSATGEPLTVDAMVVGIDGDYDMDFLGPLTAAQLFDGTDSRLTVENGKITMNLGKPKDIFLTSIENMVFSPSSVTISDKAARVFSIYYFYFSNPGGSLRESQWNFSGKAPQKDDNGFSYCQYVYADRDVTITGVDNYTPDYNFPGYEDIVIEIVKDINLKAGWNCVYYLYMENEGTYGTDVEVTVKPDDSFRWEGYLDSEYFPYPTGNSPTEGMKDTIAITSIVPDDGLVDGRETGFIIGVEYNLATQSQGEISILFNNGENINRARNDSLHTGWQIQINSGSGTQVFTTSTSPKNWGSEGDFYVIAVLNPYPRDDTGKVLAASDKKILTFAE